MRPRSLFPEWMTELTLQEQAVLVLALRGPDGDPKHTGYKTLLRAMRGSVIKSARYGRMLRLAEKERAGTFMELTTISDIVDWEKAIDDYLENEADAAVLHTYTHFMHAAEVLAHRHPNETLRSRWWMCYTKFVNRLHVEPESSATYERRLSDWGQKEWLSDIDQGE